jgi:hypothetical protein
MNAVTNATLQGVISTAEAMELCAVIECSRRAVETAELAARIERLEQRAAAQR